MEVAYISKYGPITVSDSEYSIGDETKSCKQLEIDVYGTLYSYKVSCEVVIINDKIFMMQDINRCALPNNDKNLIKAINVMAIVITDPLIEGVDIDIEFLRNEVDKMNEFSSKTERYIESMSKKGEKYTKFMINDKISYTMVEDGVIFEYESKICKILTTRVIERPHCCLTMYLYVPNLINIIMNNDKIDLTKDFKFKLSKLLRDHDNIKRVKNAKYM